MENFKIKSQLHGNPLNPPQFSVEVAGSKGEKISVACPQATRSLVALMDMQAVIGGAASHFGGPAAFAEMMSSVHGYMFESGKKAGKPWHELFHFVNDAGHCENGLYALKANYQVAGLTLESLKGFRSLQSPLTGHGEAHLFPEGVYVSNGPLGSGLPQAQGLGMAESLSKNPRLTITAISDGACMEGEAKEAFSAIPGLSAKGQMGPFVCMVSDNNTKLSGRIDDDSFSMKPTFESLSALGWDVTFVEDGHDLPAVYTAIESACDQALSDAKKPKLLWFKTIKGKGTRKTEESASGAHGFPLKSAADLMEFIEEIHSPGAVPQAMSAWASELTQLEKPKSSVKKHPGDRMKAQVGLAKALIEKYTEGLPIVSVSADLQGSTGVAPFRKEFPEASFEVGVAESNMVNVAVGLSKQGYIPVVDTFAQFGVTKGALPMIMSGLSQGPMIAVYSHTGFQDAADGASHQALTYFSMMSAIPNVDVICLTCADDAYQLMKQALDAFRAERERGEVPRSRVFFLGRENYPANFNADLSYDLGKAQVVADNAAEFSSSVTLLAAGALLENALMAHHDLAEAGIGSVVVNPSMINHPDLETLKTALEKTGGHLVTAEDHRVTGGMGAMASHALHLAGVTCKMKSLGVGDHFGRSAYTSDDLYSSHGLGISNIVDAAKAVLG